MPEQQLLEELREAWRGDWSEARAYRARVGAVELAGRRRRARVRRLVIASTLVATLGVAIGIWGVHRGSTAPGPVVSARALASRSEPRQVSFVDGSRAVLLRPDTQLDSEVRGSEIVARLSRGSARFDVHSDPDRTFSVLAGVVTVSVVGTEFTVTREGLGARVEVSKGVVRVAWAGEQVELRAGMSGLFPTPVTAAPSAEAATSDAATQVDEEWRALAKRGSYPSAYSSLSRAGASSVRDEPGDILLAADVARLSGHPQEAVQWLRRLLARHATDGRAPAAAFTLGRVLTDEVGDAAAGAEAFAKVERLAPAGTLAESALARSAEAYSRAGNTARASAMADRYLSRFPAWRYATRMKQLGSPP
jgi:transmembrane sensor